MFAVAYNPTDGPVLIDAAGRVLAGGEFGPVDTSDSVARDAIDARRLVRPSSEPGKGSDPGALAAAQEAARLEERAESFRNLDKNVLAGLAGLDTDSDLPHKSEIVASLVYSDIEPPAAKPAPSAPAGQATDSTKGA